jgi:hypothetical protein
LGGGAISAFKRTGDNDMVIFQDNEGVWRKPADTYIIDLDGKNCEEAITAIKSHFKDFVRLYPDATNLRLSYERGEYSDYDNYYLRGDVPATEEEIAAHLKNLEHWKKVREDNERKQFEALKKKFGG